MTIDTKRPTTYDEQIERLKARGCIISDENFCKEKLEAINYYWLTAYFCRLKPIKKIMWKEPVSTKYTAFMNLTAS